jgi:hypothetical protein
MGRINALLLAIGLLTGYSGFSQADSVAYSKDFTFNEGIYLTYADFRGNKPIPKDRIVTNYDRTALDFLKQETQKPEINYLDDNKAGQTVKTTKLWGYCSNNAVYIKYGEEFSKVMVIGSICHFTAFTPVYLGGYDHYTDTPANMSSGYEQEQLVIDTRTGKVGQFNYVNIEALLQQDEALYAEFKALKKKKKKELSFFYLRKFNEKHPLYFPS